MTHLGEHSATDGALLGDVVEDGDSLHHHGLHRHLGPGDVLLDHVAPLHRPVDHADRLIGSGAAREGPLELVAAGGHHDADGGASIGRLDDDGGVGEERLDVGDVGHGGEARLQDACRGGELPHPELVGATLHDGFAGCQETEARGSPERGTDRVLSGRDDGVETDLVVPCADDVLDAALLVGREPQLSDAETVVPGDVAAIEVLLLEDVQVELRVVPEHLGVAAVHGDHQDLAHPTIVWKAASLVNRCSAVTESRVGGPDPLPAASAARPPRAVPQADPCPGGHRSSDGGALLGGAPKS